MTCTYLNQLVRSWNASQVKNISVHKNGTEGDTGKKDEYHNMFMFNLELQFYVWSNLNVIPSIKKVYLL